MKRTSYLSTILFIISAWFGIFFFWTFIEFNNQLRNLFAGGLRFRGNEFEVVGYYMNNCAPYAFYAIITGLLGWALLRIRRGRAAEAVCAEHRGDFPVVQGEHECREQGEQSEHFDSASL
ncbi:MAG: hypothetical protein FWH20_05325 [Oscillospiraceae bacterium]|nr:hypothetical protein [Oscillospiraceae bacterium]